ncbi:MAG: pyridoxal-phosphate dependent enzyme [Anaerolineae bacterium]
MRIITAANEIEITLECGACGHQNRFQIPPPTCARCGHDWMEARYNYREVAQLWPRVLQGRPFTAWRYRELLPLLNDEFQITMGEGGTPLLQARHLNMMLGTPRLFIKDERQNPTNSFKDRQAALVISMMKEANITDLVVASTGNVAISYSAYSSHGGIKLWTFLPSLVPPEKMREIAIYGSEVVKVTATYDTTKKVAARFARHKGIAQDRGIRSIGTRESMKTLAFEVAEQLTEELGPPESGAPWRIPDWYIQSVSGGLGPVGFWKGCQELYEMGLIDRMPKMALIQAAGCAPMVQAFRKDVPIAAPVTDPQTQVITIATGDPGPAYTYLYNAIKENGGVFEDVTDEETFRALHVLAKMGGVSMEAAAAAAFAGLFKLLSKGIIRRDEIVVVNCSGHTFPVEKFLLEKDWFKVVPGSLATIPEPHREPEPEPISENLLGALEHLDERVQQIVVIEDNPDAARLLRRILQTRGEFQITEAHTGEAGLNLIRETHPDLVLLDLMMPDMDGFAVLDHLKADEDLENVPVIVITAKELTLRERQQIQGQIQMLLQKGTFMDEDLLEGINALLGKGEKS